MLVGWVGGLLCIISLAFDSFVPSSFASLHFLGNSTCDNCYFYFDYCSYSNRRYRVCLYFILSCREYAMLQVSGMTGRPGKKPRARKGGSFLLLLLLFSSLCNCLPCSWCFEFESLYFFCYWSLEEEWTLGRQHQEYVLEGWLRKSVGANGWVD
ncbi:hypothetical protein BKA80DRAFT_138284 [Phyllosticta citrichinensis]